MAQTVSKHKNFVMQNSLINNEISRNKKLHALTKSQEFDEDYRDYCYDEEEEDDYMNNTNGVIKVNSGTKKCPAVTVCALNYIDEVTEKIINTKYSYKITAYDKRVYNALCTLYAENKNNFSLHELYAMVTGYSKATPTKKQLDNLERCIEKLSSIRIFLDLTEELKNGFVKDRQVLINMGLIKANTKKINNVTIKDNLLHARVFTIGTDKQTVKVINIQAEPVLYSYNKAKATLLTIPTQYIGLENTNVTEKTIAFQDYFLMRIISYKNGAMHENKIMYKTLYKEIGEEKPEVRKDFKRDRDLINKLFVGWLEEGLVKSYKEIKEGRSYAGMMFEI